MINRRHPDINILPPPINNWITVCPYERCPISWARIPSIISSESKSNPSVMHKLIEEKGLPKVVFHSLRHSSITYKLKLNGGDMKSVQGDSGHAQVKMVADVYSHIIDDDRRLNAERMEAAFYSGRQATPEPVQPAATESSADDKELLLKLLQNPEMAALLKSLAKTL